MDRKPIRSSESMTKKKIVRIGMACALVCVLGAGFWLWRLQHNLPASVKLDLRAAIKARGAARPFDRFMELRYGSMDDPANRRKAFLNFFDLDHIKGMQMLTGYMKSEQRQSNIVATAEWISHFRENLSPDEKHALSDSLNSPEGIHQIRQSTSQYLTQDVRYRAAVAPVIAELMTTLAEIKKP